MSGPPDSATVGESELVAADRHSGVIRASPGSTPPPQRERRGTHDRGTHHPDGADARAGAVGALGSLNRVGWTRERRGGLRDLGARVLLRASARPGPLRGPGADTGRGAGAWPQGPARGVRIAGPAATAEPLRASPTGRWSRRGRLGAPPNRTDGRHSEARDDVGAARGNRLGALGGLNRVGWTRERRGGLRDLGARVLLRGAARARALRGPGADTGGGAGAWPEGPAGGAPTAGPAATGTEPVRASPAGRWSRRRRLGALPNRTGRRRDEARDEVDMLAKKASGEMASALKEAHEEVEDDAEIPPRHRQARARPADQARSLALTRRAHALAGGMDATYLACRGSSGIRPRS